MPSPYLQGVLRHKAEERAEAEHQLRAMQGALGLQGLLMKQQMAPLEMEFMRAKVDEIKRKGGIQDMLTQYFGGGQTPAANGGDRASMELGAIERIAALDPARGRVLSEVWKIRNPEVKWEGGIPLHPRTGQPLTGAPVIPQTNSQGFSTTKNIDPATGQISVGVTPGAPQAYGAQQNIGEEAKARYDLVKVPMPDGTERMVTRAEAARLLGGQQPAPFPAPAVPSVSPQEQSSRDAFARRIVQNEQNVASGGQSAFPTSAGIFGATQPPGHKTAAEETGKSDAKRVAEFEQKIPNLNSTLRRLDRLQTLAGNDQTYAAAGAELKLQLNSIAQAFGIKVDPKKAANTEEYIAHVAELLKERLGSKDFGSGSGVSNVDLVAAGKPLPEVMRTPQGRVQIINALRADVTRSLKDSQAARDYFRKNLSLKDFRFPSELDAQIQQTRPGAPVNNDPLGLFK